ncbi:tyrosine-type recombinase/integrase [Pseudomonas marincola]|uniref:phage integrase n=1 Tax=Pseudomonas marincola TaxID=437900 RepID=UPI001241DD85|nr:tyrosine-type recombinase/integrase [Pseudomonas marincola]
MAIEQQPDGRWKVDIEPIKGKRFRKIFKTKGEAQRFESTCRASCIDAPSWSPRLRDRRRLLELLERWALLHGNALSDYAGRKLITQRMIERLGNPVAQSFTAVNFAEYRAKRLAGGISRKTVNNELSYLRALFNCLIQYSEIDYPNPIALVKPLKLQEVELAYLDHEQVTQLFTTLASMQHAHVELISTICLATGCRWGEAEGLVPSRVKGGGVHFINTKSKRRRSIPISSELEARILQHFKQHGLFTNCRNSFDDAVRKAGLVLPPGQKAHVLRHTFASHFMANGGNILSLQKILGHSSLAMTMRYAHLAPGHMQDVISFGPTKHFRHIFDTSNGVGKEA